MYTINHTLQRFLLGVGRRLSSRFLIFGCVFLVLLAFYHSYAMTPLVRSYDTFFDLDQEIQIKRWLLPWESLFTELA